MGTPGRRQYTVVTIQGGGCGNCAGNVNPRDFERQCNKMADDGFELVVSYESMVGSCGCCTSKAAVLIFAR